jgi:hypothetical protein
MNDFLVDNHGNPKPKFDVSAGPHYPLVLQGTGWQISFQSKPEKKVIVKGTLDREELIEALCNVSMPVIVIPMIEAIFGGVEVKEKK